MPKVCCIKFLSGGARHDVPSSPVRGAVLSRTRNPSSTQTNGVGFIWTRYYWFQMKIFIVSLALCQIVIFATRPLASNIELLPRPYRIESQNSFDYLSLYSGYSIISFISYSKCKDRSLERSTFALLIVLNKISSIIEMTQNSTSYT